MNTKEENKETKEILQEDASPYGDTPIQGLTEAEAKKRRKDGHGNDIKIKTSRSYKEILKENLFTFFNIVLFILGLLLAIMGKPTEAIITSGVVFINVFIAIVQEVRAKKKLDQIALLTRPLAMIMRDGKEKKTDPSEIVLGDIVIAGPGDQILVDGKIVGHGRIDVDESLLTGESDLIPKEAGDTVLSGSFCATGKTMYEATKVGAESFANKLTKNARTFTREYTPLQKEIDLIIRILLAVILFFGILLTLRAILDEVSFLESVRMASVLFGLAPSSLFLMIVVAYAMGAVRIADKGALVQQANSVESLCNVDVLCLDKTGTLTTNKIKMNDMRVLNTGISEDKLRNILGVYARSSSASNPTSDAIARACNGEKMEFHEEVAFSSARKWSALSFDNKDLHGVFVLGAPEMLKSNITPTENLDEQVENWTSKGFRVLLFAIHPDLKSLYVEKDKPELPDDLVPLCLLCFSDEIRRDARRTLKEFREDGIQIKIISGDNPVTVAAIAKQAGLDKDGKPMKMISGPDLKEMDDEQFKQTVNNTTIFGRIVPHQKERIVKTLRAMGHYVAMTGDGVNDVLALKQANLGIAMQSGSQATRSVAGIILLNDSFRALPRAFREGQRILNGMKDILKLYMTRILYLTLLISAISILGAGFPFTPKQSSIISILTLSIPCFALALWARPGAVGKGSMTKKMMHFVIPAVVTFSAAGLLTYLFFLLLTNFQMGVPDVEYAQHALTYMTVFCGLLLIVFAEPPTEFWGGGDEINNDWKPAILSAGMLAIFIFFLVKPGLRNFYGLTLLRHPVDYLVVILIAIAWAIVLRFFWRARVIDKYLNVTLPGTPEDLDKWKNYDKLDEKDKEWMEEKIFSKFKRKSKAPEKS
ncbi:MAG: HAD-IC family P-type ATPase [Candidatus Eremiobacteraeota bacterium]|nr:HAD-IC family P-type ATPase [Candidatus Eremiobacteraeota bacterium]